MKVSVCVSSYNHAPYLRTALDSVLAQTFADFEIVVADDGSSDESPSILEAYAARHRSVRVVTHPARSRRGISATCNLAIEEARGACLAWLASDDVWFPWTLERQVSMLDRDPRVGLVYGRADVIDGSGRTTGQRIGRDVTGDDNVAASVLASNPIPASTVMIRRETVRELGGFDETLTFGDWELWIRILARWEVGFSRRPLAMYRVHGGNFSLAQGRRLTLERRLEAVTALRRKIDAVGGRLLEPACRALVDLQQSLFLFCLGDLPAARRAVASALAADPTLVENVHGLSRWLRATQHEPMQTDRPLSPPLTYGGWMAQELAAQVGGAYARRVRRRVRAGRVRHVVGLLRVAVGRRGLW